MFLIAAVLNFLSCERRLLEDEINIPDGAKVPIEINWEESGLTPQNVTVLIYNADGSLYLETFFENGGSSAYTEVYLPSGTYTVIAFNEKRDQVDYVRIRGYENLSTLEAYVTTASTTYSTQSKANDEIFVDQPGAFAVAKTEITITDEAVQLSRENRLSQNLSKAPAEATSLLVELSPVLKTSVIHINVYVYGLNNARMPALCELRNIADAYFPCTDRNSLTPVTTQFLMNNRTYTEASSTDGMVSASVVSFGITGNRESVEELLNRIYLDLSFQLVDEERTVKSYSLDITDIMKITTNVHNEVKIDIKIDTNPDDELLEIRLPDVEPEGSGDSSGIVSELIDWSTVVVPITL
jgi:hypothetical protein